MCVTWEGMGGGQFYESLLSLHLIYRPRKVKCQDTGIRVEMQVSKHCHDK